MTTETTERDALVEARKYRDWWHDPARPERVALAQHDHARCLVYEAWSREAARGKEEPGD